MTDVTDERDEDPVEVKGYIFTRWDCPECDEVNQREGHAIDEEDQCDVCGCFVHVSA